jgi:hypothetical protein
MNFFTFVSHVVSLQSKQPLFFPGVYTFSHTLWLKKATKVSNRISEAPREKRNFPQCLCSVPNSLCFGYAHSNLTTTTKMLMLF